MKQLDPYIMPNWPAPSYVHAYTTTRKGRHSQLSFDQLNLAEGTAILLKELELPEKPLWVKQTHGTVAVSLDQQRVDAPHIPEGFQNVEGDAVYTHTPNKVCAIRTADCIPLLLCSTKSGTVAAIHAGWRGLFGGIIKETIEILPDQPKDLLVWLGPSISQKHYEVDDAFKANFCAKNIDCAHAFVANAHQRWHADLYAIARIFLHAQGIPSHNIYGGDFCTYEQEDLFYSHRRDQGPGRMASLIWTIPE